MSEPTFTPAPDARPVDAPWPPMAWPPAAGTRLLGERVELVPVDPARDAADLFAALDDDRVWAHVAGRPADPAGWEQALGASAAAGRWPWLVRLVRPLGGRAAGAVVGTSSYLDASAPDARLEVGWTLYAPAVWASAVNPEAKLLLLGHAFDVLGAGRVQLKTDVRNTRSQRAVARLGAHFEGVLRRYQRRADGTVRDTALFSVTTEEWPAVRSRLHERLSALG